MSFSDIVEDLKKRSKLASKQALTEEATKTSVIMPFIKAIGFDPFNLEEVVPEFVADIGIKKGEKVDFAIKFDGKFAILIEVKPVSCALGSAQFNQLYRYFGVTDARLAILTNGREVWFFSDIDEPNKMDKRPFFIFDLQSYDEVQLGELENFQKSKFSMENILSAASNLKYTTSAANYIRKQLEEPEDDFIKLVGKQIHDGMLTRSVVEQLKPAIQSALDTVIRDRIQDKLNVAFQPENTKRTEKPESPEINQEIVTTEEETQAFMIIRALAAKTIDLDRVTIRDSKSYCAVFVDDNNRKPICRFYFNAKTVKYVGLFDANKTEKKIAINSLSDLYEMHDAIESTVSSYA